MTHSGLHSNEADRCKPRLEGQVVSRALILFTGRLCLLWARTPLGVGVVAWIYETDPSSAPGRKDLAQRENCPLMVYSSACFSPSLFLCLALSATLVASLLRVWGL